jgi:hypothetical protein
MFTSYVLLLYSCIGDVQHSCFFSRIDLTPKCCIEFAPKAEIMISFKRKRTIPLTLRGGYYSDEPDGQDHEKLHNKSSPLSYMYEVEADLNEPV